MSMRKIRVYGKQEAIFEDEMALCSVTIWYVESYTQTFRCNSWESAVCLALSEVGQRYDAVG